MGKKARGLLMLTAAAAAGIYAYNKFVENTSTTKNLMTDDDGFYYEWKHGNIFYKKMGTGSPVLLIHDTNARASGEEWSKIFKRLAKKHTVYCIDLIGCGRSDKPAIQYTNYLYVQLINDFTTQVIRDVTDVIATNMSASFVVMANALNKDLFRRIVFINPVSMFKLEETTNNVLKAKQLILQLPLIGTFIYNLMNTPVKTNLMFRSRYFNKTNLIPSTLVDTYYESAHTQKSSGRYLYASLISNYLNIDIKHAIKKMDKDLYIISSRNVNDSLAVMDDFHKINSNIAITKISNAALYPQLEVPEKVLSVLEGIL